MHVLDNKPTKQIIEMEFLDTPFLRVGKKKSTLALLNQHHKDLKDLKVHLHRGVMKKNPFSLFYEETA